MKVSLQNWFNVHFSEAAPLCFVGTSVMLEPAVDLPNNVYNVKIKVKDLQGYGEEQVVSVRICECAKEGVCAPQYFSTVLGVWGILALLLGLLLLLLLCKCPLLAIPWETLLCLPTHCYIDIVDTGSMTQAFNANFSYRCLSQLSCICILFSRFYSHISLYTYFACPLISHFQAKQFA